VTNSPKGFYKMKLTFIGVALGALMLSVPASAGGGAGAVKPTTKCFFHIPFAIGCGAPYAVGSGTTGGGVSPASVVGSPSVSGGNPPGKGGNCDKGGHGK
jgi:hypothetical protein